MSELATDEARARVATAVAAIEKKTSAEIVVVKKSESGDYRAADYLWGAIVAVVVLALFLYHPEPFDFTLFPLEQVAAFLVGALVSAHVPAIRRLFSSRANRDANVLTAARAIFVEKKISKTKRRSGVLVYLSRFEEDAAVVLDVGIDEARLGLKYKRAVANLRRAIPLHDIDALIDGLEGVGAVLAKEYPVTDDDEDELPNEVAA